MPWIPLGSQPGTTPDPLAGFEGPLLGKGEGRKEREGKRKGRKEKGKGGRKQSPPNKSLVTPFGHALK